jgi:hypothetical protein
VQKLYGFCVKRDMELIQGLSRRPFGRHNRDEHYYSTPEDRVRADNPVRLIDAFIEKLDLAQLGF